MPIESAEYSPPPSGPRELKPRLSSTKTARSTGAPSRLYMPPMALISSLACQLLRTVQDFVSLLYSLTVVHYFPIHFNPGVGLKRDLLTSDYHSRVYSLLF